MDLRLKMILEDKVIGNLKKLIGLHLYRINCPSLYIDSNDRIIAHSFSLYTKEKLWLNFESNWKESPNDNTYHKLKITESENPKDIKYDKHSHSLYQPVSSVFLPNNQSKLKKIEIYNISEITKEGEDLSYDFGLTFRYENEYYFSINVFDESITDELELLKVSEHIQKRYVELGAKLRFVID